MADASTVMIPEPAVSPRPPLRPVAPAAVPRRVAVSLVIVTWNSERWIDRCLKSIPAACEGIPYEIVVYDNGSEDQTLSKLQGNATLIRSASNDGLAVATNRAVREASGRYLFLLNPDCELAPGALTKLVEFLDAHPDVDAAAPLLVDESGDSQREFQLRRFPTLGSLVSEILLLDKVLPANRATARYRYRDLDLSKPQRIEQPAAAAFLIRREAFEAVGPLDEQFSPAWFEDVDYCRRLAASGKQVYVVPAAGARHFGGASLEHITFTEFNDIWYRNMSRYARKWLGRREAEILRWVIVLGMLLRIVAVVGGIAHRNRAKRDALRAFTTVLRHAIARWDE
ncbi:MAG TPA: glycosyltransferase family 2 protein [Thermoanaerobaculia bacterium]|nr:glycosyltransferase family 2 protein [Thermoanaerobaculia bacterium]